jgi:hypothetical protein
MIVGRQRLIETILPVQRQAVETPVSLALRGELDRPAEALLRQLVPEQRDPDEPLSLQGKDVVRVSEENLVEVVQRRIGIVRVEVREGERPAALS